MYVWLVGVVNRRWVWLVGVGGIYGCGSKGVYRFSHITYHYIFLLYLFHYSSCIYLFFFAAASLLLVHFFLVFRSCSNTFCN